MQRIKLNPFSQSIVAAGIHLLATSFALRMDFGAVADVLFSPAFAISLLTGFWGGHSGEVVALPLSAAIVGIIWLGAALAFSDLRIRLLAFVLGIFAASAAGVISGRIHNRAMQERLRMESQLERELLSSKDVDYGMWLRKGGTWGTGSNMNGLQFMYALIKHKDLAMPAIPHLKQFIADDGALQPNWTVNRKVAAQVVFALTGERVPYIGVEKDRQMYADPYDPNNHSRSIKPLPNHSLDRPAAR